MGGSGAAGLFKRLRSLRTIINGLLRSLPSITQALCGAPPAREGGREGGRERIGVIGAVGRGGGRKGGREGVRVTKESERKRETLLECESDRGRD